MMKKYYLEKFVTNVKWGVFQCERNATSILVVRLPFQSDSQLKIPVNDAMLQRAPELYFNGRHGIIRSET